MNSRQKTNRFERIDEGVCVQDILHIRSLAASCPAFFLISSAVGRSVQAPARAATVSGHVLMVFSLIRPTIHLLLDILFLMTIFTIFFSVSESR